MMLPVRPLYSRDRVSPHGPAGIWDRNFLEVLMQTVVLSVWGLCLLFVAVMYLYRSRLTRDEEDQIFLDDSFSHERTAQAVIAAKVQKIEPLVRTSVWVAGVATALVAVYYAWDIFNQFK
jgi:Tfp pilus assembly protein PilN